MLTPALSWRRPLPASKFWTRVVVCEAVGSGRGGCLVPGSVSLKCTSSHVEGRQGCRGTAGGRGRPPPLQQATRGGPPWPPDLAPRGLGPVFGEVRLLP